MTPGQPIPKDAAESWTLRPLLYVGDWKVSLALYQERLGFRPVEESWTEAGAMYWCHVARGGCALMLQQAEPEDDPGSLRGAGAIVYFTGEDVDRLREELFGRGLALRAPRRSHYGMRRIDVHDPDGYHLCLQSPG